MDCLSSRPCARAAFIAIAFALSACHSTTKDPTTRGFVEPNAIRAQAIAALGALDDPRSDQLLVTLATTMELNAPPDILVQISALNEVARRKDRIAEQVGMRTELLTKLRPVLSRISAVALELPASQQADYLRLSRYLENELLTVRVAAATLNELARGGLNDADEASAAISQHNEVMSASMDPGASTAGLAAAMAPLKLLALTEIEAVSTAARRSAFEIAPTLLIDWLLERLAESRAGRAALTRELMNACDRVNALTVGSVAMAIFAASLEAASSFRRRTSPHPNGGRPGSRRYRSRWPTRCTERSWRISRQDSSTCSKCARISFFHSSKLKSNRA